jgi:hypothetical protein
MSLGIFSPAVLFGLERGNNDLPVFFMLAVSVWAIKKSIGGSVAIIGIAFLLKLYPVFAISVFFREHKRTFQKLLVFSVTAAAVYTAIMFGEIKLVWQQTHLWNTGIMSYGVLVASRRFSEHAVFWRSASYIAVLLIVAFSILHASRVPVRPNSEDRHLDAFRIGSAIYIGTFLLGANWDYRLVFLLFVVPQLLLWTRAGSDWIRRIAVITATCVIAALWSLITQAPPWSLITQARPIHTPVVKMDHIWIATDWLWKWGVFSGILYLSIYSCPDWLKNWFASASARHRSMPAFTSSGTDNLPL